MVTVLGPPVSLFPADHADTGWSVLFPDRGGVREMSEQQCWSMNSAGRRCGEPAEPASFFCAQHRHIGTGARIMSVWRAPEAEMPPDLVAALRRYAPEVTFPEAEPATLESTVVAEPVAGLPASRPGRRRQSASLRHAEFFRTPSIASPPGEGDAMGHDSRPDSDREDGSGREGEPERGAQTSSPCDPSSSSVSLHLGGEGGGETQLDWLQAMLREAMEEVMAGDAAPLQKANALARLAGLYLKAGRAKELEQENRALRRRLAEAEARLAALEMRLAAGPPREACIEPRDAGRPEPGGSLALPKWEETSSSCANPGARSMARAAEEGAAAPGSPVLLLTGRTDGGRDPP